MKLTVNVQLMYSVSGATAAGLNIILEPQLCGKLIIGKWTMQLCSATYLKKLFLNWNSYSAISFNQSLCKVKSSFIQRKTFDSPHIIKQKSKRMKLKRPICAQAKMNCLKSEDVFRKGPHMSNTCFRVFPAVSTRKASKP